MFANQYEQQRLAVIDIFNRYVKNRDEFRNSLNLGDGRDDADMAIVQREVEKLEANKYTLAIVGESKAGKSTFINAFLGKPILPTGVLQCTSGIIEIVDTDTDHDKKRVYFKVSYAKQPDQAKVEYEAPLNSDTTPLQKRLEEIAAIQEEYRSLPVFQLNQFLSEKKPKQITNSLVKDLCEQLLKEEKNNPHKLLGEEFKRRVQKYLEEYKDLSKIPVKICVGYPVGLKFARIRIVDTPGVNARGGLKTATVNAIIEANAVIFIHLLKNIASESLQDFFKNSVPKQAHENIFMFLTHKAHHTKEDVEATLKETKNLYPEIEAGRIVVVDSMLKQIADELTGKSSLDALMEDEEKENLLAKFERRCKGDVTKVRESVLADSNFPAVKTLLTNFSEQALVGQLRWVVEQVAEGYEQQQKDYDQQIRLIGWKAEFEKTPAKFDEEIDKLKNLLTGYQAQLTSFSRQQKGKYTGLHSEVNTRFSTLKKTYYSMLGSARDEDQIRKHIMDFNTDCEKEATFLINQLSEEYKAEMVRVRAEFKEDQIAIPRINLESISEEAKKRAYEIITLPGDRKLRVVLGTIAGGILGGIFGFAMAGPVGAALAAKAAAAATTVAVTTATTAVVTTATGAITLAAVGAADEYMNSTPIQTISRFNEETFKNDFISSARTVVISISDKMPDVISNLCGSYDKQFTDNLSRIITERQNAYEQLKKDKEDAEKLRRLESNSSNVVVELKKIDDVTTKLSLV